MELGPFWIHQFTSLGDTLAAAKVRTQCRNIVVVALCPNGEEEEE